MYSMICSRRGSVCSSSGSFVLRNSRTSSCSSSVRLSRGIMRCGMIILFVFMRRCGCVPCSIQKDWSLEYANRYLPTVTNISEISMSCSWGGRDAYMRSESVPSTIRIANRMFPKIKAAIELATAIIPTVQYQSAPLWL